MKINSYFLILFVFLSFLFIFPGEGFGITNKLQPETNITSNSLRVNNKKDTAVFTGHVVVIKGGLRIFSSVLNVVYTKKHKIKMLVATGNVHIIKGKNNITGGKAVYYDKKGIVVITKNPVAYEGKNKIAGKKIIVNFATGISTVIGDAERRVSAVVYSNKSLTVGKSFGKKNR
ncbi:LptA/OstA family protein [Candidatus Acidulodesulfobacterium sp. H_13]|uniref:LptA/OstA family protein n=1 Tax=Candidatus Acidulodesulfobacterium sp. H_13 TaxID=3395470 RepID=UPI003AF5771B